MGDTRYCAEGLEHSHLDQLPKNEEQTHLEKSAEEDEGPKHVDVAK